jgi:hypothetical protein
VPLLATALDPNQILGAAVTIVIAIIGLIGVTIGQNRRLKVVDKKTDELLTNGGATVADGVYATQAEVSKIREVQDKMAETQSQVRETINQILHNQTQGFTQAVNLIQELGAVKQAQVSADLHAANFERHTSEQFAVVNQRLDSLALEVARLSPSPITGPVPVIPEEKQDV